MNMKKCFALLLCLFVTLAAGCSEQETGNHEIQNDKSAGTEIIVSDTDTHKFSVYVKEVGEGYVLVSPVSGGEAVSAELISVSPDNISDNSLPSVGDVYEIVCDGTIKETYPAQLNEIYEMNCVEKGYGLKDMNTIKKIENEEIYNLYEIDMDAIESVLCNYTWSEGTGDCLCDYELTVDKVQYMYHADCGTFSDVTNRKHITLDETHKELMNGLMEQFVSVRYWSSGPAQLID